MSFAPVDPESPRPRPCIARRWASCWSSGCTPPSPPRCIRAATTQSAYPSLAAENFTGLSDFPVRSSQNSCSSVSSADQALSSMSCGSCSLSPSSSWHSSKTSVHASSTTMSQSSCCCWSSHFILHPLHSLDLLRALLTSKCPLARVLRLLLFIFHVLDLDGGGTCRAGARGFSSTSFLTSSCLTRFAARPSCPKIGTRSTHVPRARLSGSLILVGGTTHLRPSTRPSRTLPKFSSTNPPRHVLLVSHPWPLNLDLPSVTGKPSLSTILSPTTPLPMTSLRFSDHDLSSASFLPAILVRVTLFGVSDDGLLFACLLAARCLRTCKSPSSPLLLHKLLMSGVFPSRSTANLFKKTDTNHTNQLTTRWSAILPLTRVSVAPFGTLIGPSTVKFPLSITPLLCDYPAGSRRSRAPGRCSKPDLHDPNRAPAGWHTCAKPRARDLLPS